MQDFISKLGNFLKNFQQIKTNKQHASSDHSSHHHSHISTQHSVKRNLINLAISIVIILLTPFIIGIFTKENLSTVRKEYQSENQIEPVSAQLGTIKKIEEKSQKQEDYEIITQNMLVKLDSGESVPVENIVYEAKLKPKLKIGQKIYISEYQNYQNQTAFVYVDAYRLDKIFWLIAIFMIFVVILTGIKGLNAFLGLVFASMVIFNYLLPEVLIGSTILWTTFVAAVLIAGFSMFLSHGFNKFTSIAVVSTLITIILVTLVSIIVTQLMDFSGITSHELSHLQNFQTLNQVGLNLKGLFLASIVLGTLGVLDDITISQAIIVQELKNSNPKESKAKIFARSLNIGREHIVSLINTLSIAYIATSLPFVIQFIVFGYEDVMVLINSEVISGEIVRTLVGSFTLLSAIPLTTFLAIHFLEKNTD